MLENVLIHKAGLVQSQCSRQTARASRCTGDEIATMLKIGEWGNLEHFCLGSAAMSNERCSVMGHSSTATEKGSLLETALSVARWVYRIV